MMQKGIGKEWLLLWNATTSDSLSGEENNLNANFLLMPVAWSVYFDYFLIYF